MVITLDLSPMNSRKISPLVSTTCPWRTFCRLWSFCSSALQLFSMRLPAALTLLKTCLTMMTCDFQFKCSHAGISKSLIRKQQTSKLHQSQHPYEKPSSKRKKGIYTVSRQFYVQSGAREQLLFFQSEAQHSSSRAHKEDYSLAPECA